jgi:DNA-binding transcriptional ArsR family regulator
MQEVVGVVKALSADTRLRVLKLLQSGPMTVAELQQALELRRQTVSYHLQVLQQGGLVVSRLEDGRTVYSSATPSVADEGGKFERFLVHALEDVC